MEAPPNTKARSSVATATPNEHKHTPIPLADWKKKILSLANDPDISPTELARVVGAAHAELKEIRQWRKLFDEPGMPFGRTKAEQLLRVNTLLDRLSANEIMRLPRKRTVLYDVAECRHMPINRLIADGHISPEMTRRQSRLLLRKDRYVRGRSHRQIMEDLKRSISTGIPPWFSAKS